MSVDYHLEMATAVSAAEVAGTLCEVARPLGLFGTEDLPGNVLGDGVVSATGTWIRAGERKPGPPLWDPVISDLGITPTVWVMFRLGKRHDCCDQQDDMIRLVDGLLGRVRGDAVLHFQSEQIWLLRRGDELSLSAQDDIWPPRRLAAVSRPYRRAALVFAYE
ncbi:SitI3 family protein [Streptomyces chattanoogensis]|uniref:SitI3 family protein n=1 Tax=Streptomyces chattanoogensis TaxID=66876 RepID=UPI0036B826B8